MIQIEASIQIDQPCERVFGFLADVDNLPKWQAGVIESILQGLGQPATHLRDAESPEAKAKLRSRTEEAQALGIFGAPTFVVDGEIFWGNDRLETAVAWALSRDRRS